MLPHADRASTRAEILIGRTLATCVHPYAAWRTRSIKNRVLLIAGFAAVSYIVSLGCLFAMPALFR
jgi:hypothetical protein